MATVLVIEDDPDMRELERTALSGSGHEVMLASNGSEGLRELERRKPCVILLDLMMPVMDGWEFRKRQQAEPALADVPVIVLSALDRAQARAADLTGVEFLKKPLDFDRLLDLVRRHCRQEA